MSNDRFIRTEMVVGQVGMEKLKNAHVAVFGVGGVGSFSAESLARAGIGELTLIDFDKVDISNINRQIHALTDTLGMSKVELMQSRILQINPECKVNIYASLFNKETADDIFNLNWDYVIDAIDMVSSKILLVEMCYEHNIKIMASMGTGNKMDPTKFAVADIFKTSVCPLAKVMRREFKKRNIKKLKVVFSTEDPVIPLPLVVDEYRPRKQIPGSISFVPSVAGLIITSEVVKDLLK
ncbi:MAG: tRNA threonylcarbamoyladenosine dehydratase [Acidaminobacteraceae bacterium]